VVMARFIRIYTGRLPALRFSECQIAKAAREGLVIVRTRTGKGVDSPGGIAVCNVPARLRRDLVDFDFRVF
jgi:hypothetical protein